jgi:segregation and condensation protein A
MSSLEGTSYKVKLEVFEGPLDLLLYLVRVHELDIHDIPIGKITEEYLKILRTLNLDNVSEFVVMAATLLLIKSRSLLPTQAKITEEDEEDLRAELIKQLLEYQQYKNAALVLRKFEGEQSKLYSRRVARVEEETFLEVNLFDLLSSYQSLLTAVSLPVVEIQDDSITVKEKISELELLLREREYLLLEELLPPPTQKIVLIVTFLALLELVRLQRVFLSQREPFGEVRIYRRKE